MNIQGKFNQLWNDAALRWGVRLAVCITLPLVYGAIFNDMEDAFWIAIAAQSVALIEFRGSFSIRFRILIGSIFFVIIFGVLGMVAGLYPWIHLIIMFFVGFISALFKNLGDRGMGMSLSIFILYILSSAYPSIEYVDIIDRAVNLLMGGMTVFVIVIFGTLFQRRNKPFYQFLAHLLNEMGILSNIHMSGWGNQGKYSNLHTIFNQEGKIREYINTFINFYSSNTTHQNDKTEHYKNLLTQRKTLILIHSLQLSIYEQTLLLRRYKNENNVDVSIHSMLRVMNQLNTFLQRYYVSERYEDYELWKNRIQRLQKINEVLLRYEWSINTELQFKKISHNISRMLLLYRKIDSLLSSQNPKKYYRYTNFSQLISILHPNEFGNEFANLFRFEKEVTYHALRVGIAAFIGLFIAENFFPDHGYWIPFTAIIVAQPYATATLKRGIQRSLGTILGVFVGFLIILLPHPDFWNFIVVFIAAIFSVYFLKKNYGVTSFFMTLIIVGLLSIKPPLDTDILWTRIIATVIGSSIIIFINYFLFRITESDHIDHLLQKAVKDNYSYFIQGLNSVVQQDNWMMKKRIAENSNVALFNSYNRLRTDITDKINDEQMHTYFSIITHIFRCTKELNEFLTHHELENDTSSSHVRIDNYYYQIKHKYNLIISLLEIENDIPNTIATFTFSPKLKIHFEKIILELEYIISDIQKIKKAAKT